MRDDYTLFGFTMRFMLLKKRVVNNFLKDTDLNAVDAGIMQILSKHPGYGQDQLVETTMLDRASVARSMKKLEHLKYVSRAVDPNNRRKKIVSITDSGEDFVNEINSSLSEINEMIYKNITEEESDQLEKILAKVYNNFDFNKFSDDK
ncbi:MarR family winged helix-turn-helix transcriptional regulator [Companilactobacillus metriopterae]|uniref:MarR family winged helix-turn-helix transcriptional regulator n=1 Tax=Companilactobacillus metriopterae TaxID=1909267 RepID=UPI00100AC4EE|nr:MarR family winged helix-turn-helix transcriptional regulator [Companilactobacillus metriopterae]